MINAATYQNDKEWMSRHGVNVGMGLKDPAVNYQRTKDEKYLKDLKTGFNDLMTLHGLPMGIYSADEGYGIMCHCRGAIFIGADHWYYRRPVLYGCTRKNDI